MFIIKKTKTVLDKTPKKIWSLNQLKIGENLVGIPHAEYYKNTKGNQFVRLSLDAGYSNCQIFFLIFSFPTQKILNKKYHNSFELVRFYREANNIPVDEDITQLHDINFQEIIDWLNSLQTLKIRVINQNMNGFKNIEIVSYTDNNLAEEVGFKKWIID